MAELSHPYFADFIRNEAQRYARQFLAPYREQWTPLPLLRRMLELNGIRRTDEWVLEACAGLVEVSEYQMPDGTAVNMVRLSALPSLH